jgi:hypothetical protein
VSVVPASRADAQRAANLRAALAFLRLPPTEPELLSVISDIDGFEPNSDQIR